MTSKLIDKIVLPHGLRSLNDEQLKIVTKELRQELIENIANSGGHFASSLGVTELTVVLHHLFNTPNEKIIWDVGHQGYIHKMVTGRRDRMNTIRKKNGLSGFLRRDESEFDAFGAGHAGTSISAAVGMAESFRRQGKKDKVIAVIGDGSLTAGMAFEALNHAGDIQLDNLIVVLNDNDMSISPNVGALSRFFSLALTNKATTYARNWVKSIYKRGLLPELVYKAIDRGEEAALGFLGTPAMLFESFGLRYIGPVDGHSVDDLKHALINAKSQTVPVIVHIRTTKGKGFSYAEEDPLKWHATTPFPFDKVKGEIIKSGTSSTNTNNIQKIPQSYSSYFGDTVLKLIKDNPKVVAITAAMSSGTGLDVVRKDFPNNFYDVGICEQHAVTFAAGLATEGFIPICTIYSTFLQRAYDQVVHDVCIQNLPVIFAMDRAGVVGNDGETHQGTFDIAYLRTIPNMVVMSPKDESELEDMLFTATKFNGPSAIRYPRGNGVGAKEKSKPNLIPIGKGEIIQSGSDVLIIGLGPIVNLATKVANKLKKEAKLSTTVINARFAKPLDLELFAKELPNYKVICVLEDHALMGGFGSAILELVNDNDIQLQTKIIRFGIKDHFVTHATQDEQWDDNGISVDKVVEKILAQRVWSIESRSVLVEGLA